MNKEQKRLKKEYKENPYRVRNLMYWRKDPKTVDTCPICNKLFSEHSLKDMGVCTDKAFVNIEKAKQDLEIVNSNWGKGGMICAAIERHSVGHGLNSRMFEENNKEKL